MKNFSTARNFNCTAAILAIAFVGMLGSPAQAVLNVANPSFESPDISEPPISNWFYIGTPTDWSAIDPSNSRRIIDGTSVETAPAMTPFNMTGSQFAMIGAGFTLGDGSGAGADLFQNIGTTDGLSNVTLLVDTARRRDVDMGGIPPGDITIGIWQDTDANLVPDSPLATLPILAAAQTDTFLPKAITALAVPGGTQLYVRLTAADSAPTFEGFRQTLVDNVQILVAAVPEPSSVLLLGLAAVIVAPCGRRMRN